MSRAADVLEAMAALPFATLDALLPPGPALVLAPHPDDETLGCGGLIACAAAHGRALHVLFVTDGAASHPNSRAWPPQRRRALREEEARAAAHALGLPPARLGFLGLPDSAAPHSGAAFDDAVARISAHAQARSVRTLLATWEHDPHGDHVAVSRMARAAAHVSGARLLSYPVWGWTLPPEQHLPEPTPAGWRLDIRGVLDAKRRAIAAHRSQSTDLIADDPDGFRLTDDFIALFTRPFEVFLEG